MYRVPFIVFDNVTMEVFLNGAKITTQAATLAELLEEQHVPTEGIAVAIGIRIIRRAEWTKTPIADQAEITLIRATQGG